MDKTSALIALIILVDVLITFLAARLGSKWIFATIALNLILVNIWANTFISILGLTANISNIFYACVFLATQLIIEDKRELPERIKWFGAGFVISYLILSQLSLQLLSLQSPDAASEALKTLLSISPRLALASLIAFILAQDIHNAIYLKLEKFWSHKYLWARSLIANSSAQLVDSLLFFTIAFYGVNTAFVSAILSGWIIKTLVVLAAIPLLYLHKHLART